MEDGISRAAALLSEPERELLELISWERLSVAEIAVVLGCTTNTAHQRIHRLRRNLRTHLATIDRDEPVTTRGSSL